MICCRLLACNCSIRLQLQINWILRNTGTSFLPRSCLDQWEMPFFQIDWRICWADICTRVECLMSLWRKFLSFGCVFSFLLLKCAELQYKILFPSLAKSSLVTLDVLYFVWKLTHGENQAIESANLAETFHLRYVTEQGNLFLFRMYQVHVDRSPNFCSWGFYVSFNFALKLGHTRFLVTIHNHCHI